MSGPRLQSTLLTFAERIETDRRRVAEIYLEHPEALANDTWLLRFYEQKYGGTSGRESSITRRGREVRKKWREAVR